MQLKLYIPKSDQALQQTPETRAGVIDGHLKELLNGDFEKSSNALVAELGRLNRAELDEEARFKLNLLYEPAVLKLIGNLISTLPENGPPQSNAHRQIATLGYELALELSYAWKLSYIGLEQRRSLFGANKSKQTALNHLLEAMSCLISTSYRTYTSPPSQCWHELHQVHDLLRKEHTPTAPENDGNPPSFEAPYKRALLLALADPFRFTRTEIEVATTYLNKFHHFAKLSSGDKIKNTHFLVDISADAPFSQNDGPDQPKSLALDTHATCKHLRSLIVKLNTGEAFRDLGLSDAISPRFDGLTFLGKLHQAWHGDSKRGFTRYAADKAHVQIISGIPAIHRLFDPKQKPSDPNDPKASATNATADLADQSLPAKWRVLNDSASGLSISAHAQEVSQLRLGNLIAFRMDDENSPGWILGVIRWGKMSKGQMVSAGVEKLAPKASSVVLRLLHGNLANIGQPALLIPPNPKLQIDERLLLPSGLYKRGYSADMWHNGQSRRIVLGSLVEKSPFFDLVELEPA